jgi:predicted pyridoxine 5'-phosphate oxidase superfamily flavin-nucleotide-binding protein
MSAVEPTTELHSAFSEPGAQAPPWADVLDVLTNSEMFWLSSVRRDGRPHVTPLPTIWLDGALHFCTGDAEQKSRNLLRDRRCVLTTGTNALRGGVDVVVEGTAVRVTDRDRLASLAALWKSKLDWDFQVGDDAFRDGDGRTGLVFAVRPGKVLAFGKDPYSQTRYRFAG